MTHKYQGLKNDKKDIIDIDWDDLPSDEEIARPAQQPRAFVGDPATVTQARKYPGMSGAAHQQVVGKKSGLAGAVGGSSVLQNLLAGVVGALIAWAFTEFFFNRDSSQVKSYAELLISVGAWMAFIGAFTSAALGAADGIISKVYEKAFKNGAIAFGIGFVGCFVGGIIAQYIYSSLGGGLKGGGSQVLARAAGWAVGGAFLGMAYGATGRSWKKVFNGLLGGLVGGLLGGLAFDFIGSAMQTSTGSSARFFGILAMGACTGAAIGLVEEARKDAWLRVEAGPMAGKQFIIYGNVTTIGSNPKCDIVLIKDPSVLAEHCRIVQSGTRYVLEVAQNARVAVNGSSSGSCRLSGGTVLQIGQSQLVYEEKKHQGQY
ncbi:MAG: FHA domain-containing protein [Bacillota bacterium]